MIQNILHNIGGIAAYGVLSLCLFALLFTGVFTWACLQRKAHLERISRLPLEPDEPTRQEVTYE